MSTVKAADVRLFMLSQLADQLREHDIDESQVTEDFDLLERGLIDSFGLVQLLSAIEAHFAIQVDLEDLDTEYVTSVGPLCRHIESQTAGRTDG